ITYLFPSSSSSSSSSCSLFTISPHRHPHATPFTLFPLLTHAPPCPIRPIQLLPAPSWIFTPLNRGCLVFCSAAAGRTEI
ncbi:hypothetical protein CHARACLAT_018889, partial [Characodon lateralis]|nr:hypothetical protein [Characodon lateralis]